MSKTKIIATVGPASQSAEVLERFVEEGVDVVRFNMSHGTLEQHTETLATVRAVAERKGAHVAILADLCGPKVRTGEMDPERSTIAVGEDCVIARSLDEGQTGTAARLVTNTAHLVDDLQVGHAVLIDDGAIALRVTETRDDEVTCRCGAGGTIGSRKGINVPDTDLGVDSITKKDVADLKWAVDSKVDFVAMSFVRRVADIEAIKKTLLDLEADIPVVAKIETPQAVEVIDEIIGVTDAILVARGDLGVEMDVTKLPMLQKSIVLKCHEMGRPVIVATQMLHSMVENAVPTRAEVSDVANAVLDGADAVMLSAESAAGAFPVPSVRMMRRIAEQVHEAKAEMGDRWSDSLAHRMRVGYLRDATTSAVARSAALVAHDLGAKMIAVWCRRGTTARWISKYRVSQMVVGMSSDAATCRRLGLSYGISPMLVDDVFAEGDRSWVELEELILKEFPMNPEDIIVLVGDPVALEREPRLTIHVVGERRSRSAGTKGRRD